MFGGEPSPSVVPARVGMADVRHVETLTSALRAVDHEYGGGSCREAVLALLKWVRTLLEAEGVDQVKERLYVAAADLHNLAGWASFDMGLLDSANVHFDTALELAKQTQNRELEADILYRMGRIHLHYELVEDALSTFQSGQPVAKAGGSSLAVSILHANEAWAFAKMGADHDALLQLGRAQDQFARSNPAEAPPWAKFFDEADLESMIGTVHAELARKCDVKYAETAIPRLASAVASAGEDTARSRSLALAALAMSHLLQGDADQAAEVGTQAITLAEPIRSTRTRDRMRPLKQEAEKLRGNRAADELAEKLAVFVDSGRGAA